MNLWDYDKVIINSSAGKDSQTMLRKVCRMADAQGYPSDNLVVVHADLGRVEWEGTAALAERQAAAYGLRFEKVSREKGDLLEQVERRGMWPDSRNRYCTSDQKRGQIKKVMTKLGREIKEATGRGTPEKPIHVLNCMGLRAEESPARAKKAAFELNAGASTKSRKVWNWLPILDWTEEQVWADIHESGIEYHEAYDLGMPRLSCVFCIFAPKKALILAGKHNRELLDQYAEVEIKIDHKFRQDTSIAEIRDLVAQDVEIDGSIDGAWNM